MRARQPPPSALSANKQVGTRNLADLALSSSRGARLCFCSSTAAVLGNAKPSARIPEQFTDDPDAAAPLGYARSKWVAEQIYQRLLRGRAIVVRIGQLCADTVGGVWNETEAWPLMFASVNVVGCLPELEEVGYTCVCVFCHTVFAVH